MPQGARLTYSDLSSFPDDGLRRELIDGELIVSPSPVTRHQRLVGRLHGVFWAALQHDPAAGEIFLAPFDVVFSEDNVVEPDLLFITRDQTILTDKNVQGPPALVIEVLSESRIDRLRKRDLYARFGVPDYWVVDPEADRVEIYQLEGSAYRKPEILESGETLRYPPVPSLAIDLTQLFSR